MKPQFITALYTGLEGTIFNGNSDGVIDRYCPSLRSLAKGGYPIICHISSAQHAEIQGRLAGLPNIQLVVSELKMNPFHEQINAIKTKYAEHYRHSPNWKFRCVEIMWGKFSWLQNCLHMIDEQDSIFWIDAGLFHPGLIEDDYRSITSVDEYDFDTITQHRNLHADLTKYAGDRILNITGTMVNHGFDDYAKVFPDRPEYSVAGGVFGGKKQLVQQYIESMLELMFLTLSKDALLKEEELMYHLHQLNPGLYTDFRFNTWYHKGWKDIYDPNTHVGFSDFYKAIRQ